MKRYNILIVGVGGQGTMTLGAVLKRIGQKKGWIVVGTETRGASQREGAVDSSVRYVMFEPGEDRNERTSVISPLIPMGAADILIALETNEALRNAKFASQKTCIVVNLYEIPPPQAVSEKWKGATFDEVVQLMKTFSPDVRTLKANELSKECFGDFSMSNVIMLGAALGTGKMPMSADDVKEALKHEVGRSYPDFIKGLEIGIDEISKR